MKLNTLKVQIAAIALVGALGIAPAVQAEVVKLGADLKGASGGGTGKLEGTYDTTGKKLSYTLTYSGLSGAPVAAHFHGPADPGANAGVAVPIAPPLTSPINGTATLTDAQAAELLAGKYYVNLHTAANPAGEIRGQVQKAK